MLELLKMMSGTDDIGDLTLHIPSPQCCAVTFIEKLDGQSLNLSSEEFELYMSGQASPQASGPSSCSTGSAALTQVHKRLEMLTGLGERQERVMEKARQLESDLIDWTDEVEQKVQSILESFPAETGTSVASGSMPAAASAIDADNIENEHLPPPLQPQVFAGWSGEIFSKIHTPLGFNPSFSFPLQLIFTVRILQEQQSVMDHFKFGQLAQTTSCYIFITSLLHRFVKGDNWLALIFTCFWPSVSSF